MLNWRVFAFVMLLSAILPIPAPGAEAPLRVGLTGKYPPFNYFDEQGRLSGFDVDVANHLCQSLDRPCKFVILQWDGILAALLSGKIDLIVGSMAITPERQQQALFSLPYYESGGQVFGVSDSLDLKTPGIRLGVTLGTTYEASLRKRFPQAQVRTYKGDSEILEDVRVGRLDAIVTDRLVGGYMIRASGLNLKPVGPPLFEERMGIPAHPDQTRLIEQVDQSIRQLRASPAYEQLTKKYFGLGVASAEPGFSWATALLLLLKGLWATIKVSSLGLSLGLLLSAGVATLILAGSTPIRLAAIAGTDFVRATPFLIQLFAVYFGLPALGIVIHAFTAAVLTIAVHSSAYLAEVIVAGFRSIPKEQWHAAKILGLSRWQTLRYVVAPQMIPLITAPSLNTIVAMIKDSAIVSVISVYELTMQTQQLISSTYRPFSFYLIAAGLYALLTYPLILGGRKWAARAHLGEQNAK